MLELLHRQLVVHFRNSLNDIDYPLRKLFVVRSRVINKSLDNKLFIVNAE